jgi:protein-disulfide isomerase
MLNVNNLALKALMTTSPPKQNLILAGVIALLAVDAATFFTVGKLNAAAVPIAPNDLDQSIHEYLISHPGVLREMSGLLQKQDQEARQQQFRKAVAGVRGDLIDAKGEAVSGDPEADITVVEFYDAQCPFCKAMAPDLEKLRKEDEHIRVVYREFPILGDASEIAAKAEMAAQRQGVYDKFHQTLMADKTPEHQLTEAKILALASSSGANIPSLKRDMAAKDISDRIGANRQLANALGVDATPGLIFLGPTPASDYLSPGLMTYDALKGRLAEMRRLASRP